MRVVKSFEITIDEVVKSLNEEGLQELLIAASLQLQERCKYCKEYYDGIVQTVVNENEELLNAKDATISKMETVAPPEPQKCSPKKKAGKEPPKVKTWQADEIALLRELYPTDMSVADIAVRIGRSEDAVQIKASKLGLLRPRAAKLTIPADEQELTAIEKDVKIIREAMGAELPDSEDAMAYLEDEPSEESAVPSSYADKKIAHTQAQKLASKYGKKAMQGTPVVIDSKTVVIKRSKKGDKS